MTRIRADLCLLFVAFVWGTAFVAQKAGMAGIGPFTFVAVRFLLSALVVVPFAIRECRGQGYVSREELTRMVPAISCCAIGVCLQQAGLQSTSVTNAGFITSLYVLFTPFIAWIVFRARLAWTIWPACILSIGGVWGLNGGSFSALSTGDLLILLCAICYAGHVASTGWYLSRHDRPILFSLFQYVATMMLGGAGMLIAEQPTLPAIIDNWLALAYAGVISGGVAYTLQAIAQRHTPAADAAIILAAESIFATAAGSWLLAERFTQDKLVGCGLILAAILIVQVTALRAGTQEKA